MADAFDGLRQPIVPIDPRPEFAADLRRRLLGEFGLVPTQGGTMTTETAPASATVRATGLVPYLCATPAADAIDFYAAAFGAHETLRVASDDGRVGHAELRIGGMRVFVSDEAPNIGVLSPTTLGGSAVTLYLEVDDCDALYDRALAAGAHSEREPADQPHGNRAAVVRDPFGHRWMLSQHIEDVSLREYQQRSAADGWVATGSDDALEPPKQD